MPVLSSIPRPVVGDLTGALGDLGTVLPLAAGLIIAAGLDPAAFFLTFGLASLIAGVAFRLPLPIQPQKAVAAAAIAQPWPTSWLHGAAVGSGVVWVLLACTPALRWLARAVPGFVSQGVQLALAAILTVEAVRLLSGDAELAAAALLLMVLSLWMRLTALTLTFLLALLVMPASAFELRFEPSLPAVTVPGVPEISAAMLAGGFAQLPLTLANAIFSTVALLIVYFPNRPVTTAQLGVSTGLLNVGAGLLGGAPLCHGAGGLAAQHLYGARTVWKNIIEASAALAIGLFFASSVRPALEAFPLPLLGGLLLLVAVELLGASRGLHGWRSWIALFIVAVTLLTNIGIAFLLGLAVTYAVRWLVHRGWLPRLTHRTPVEYLHHISDFVLRDRNDYRPAR
jgi:hypothetical protein